MSKRERRRLVRLSVSGILLVLVVAIKLLMPDLANAYKDKLLHLMGENTDFVEAFSAVGKAFSKEGGIRDTLEDAYTAVFGEKKPEEAASPAQTAAVFSGVYTPESLPEQTALDQRVLGFAYAPPLEGTVTSSFGYRLHPLENKVKFHYGTDFAANSGTAVCAFADGTVLAAGQDDGYGNYVKIRHADGYTTLYGHCSKLLVRAGETVTMGQEIALVGATGKATGPHLHFELMHDGYYYNPEFYLAAV